MHGDTRKTVRKVGFPSFLFFFTPTLGVCQSACSRERENNSASMENMSVEAREMFLTRHAGCTELRFKIVLV